MIVTPLMCLTFAIYHESRGTNLSSMIKVGNVVVNRTADKEYCKTVFKKGQFSWTNKIKYKANFKSYKAMLDYYNITDLNSYFNSVQAATIAIHYSMTDANFYHDKSIKHFKFNAGKVVSSNKYFIFYRG